MDNNYCVYQHISPKGKKYIGITKVEPLDRWANGFGYIENRILFSDIVRYGWDNFKHEILHENLTRYEAEKIERELIIEQNLTDCDFGYNQIEGVRGYKRPEEVRKRISETMSKKKARAIIQYDLDGNKIAEYKSMREAERQTGARAGNISACCLGIACTANGYIWKYAESIQDKSISSR